MIWADATRAPALQKIANTFGSANGIKVVVQTIAANLQSVYVTATKAGQGPDVVVGANDWIGNLLQNGTIEPISLSASVKAQFRPIALTGVTYNGQIYGLPYGVENIGLFYNTKLVSTPPATMEQLASMGKALVSQKKVKYPLALQIGATGDPYHMFPLYTSAGGTLFGKSANGNYNPHDFGIAKPTAGTAMAKIQALAKEGVISRSIDANNSISLFAGGQAPFLISGPWAESTIGTKVSYNVAKIPQFSGGKPAAPFIGVQSFFISSKAKNKSFAEEFVDNYLSKPNVAPALFSAEPLPAANTQAYNTELATNKYVKGFAAAGADGEILPAIPQMSSVWDPWGKAEAAIVGGANPSTTMSSAGRAIQQVIGK